MAKSFVRATLLRKDGRKKLTSTNWKYLQEAVQVSLMNIAPLYPYVNVPPQAIGVTVHKAAESLLGSIEYNEFPRYVLPLQTTQMWPSHKGLRTRNKD